MDEVVDALRAQQAELASYVADLDAAGLGRPSRCAGWTVADVLLHLAQTDEMAVASLAGDLPGYLDRASAGVTFTGSTVDDWAGVLVDAQRGEPEAARDRWLVAADAEAAAFAAADPHARVQWVAGEMAARTLATTRLTEAWIHTVDVAVAFGPEPAPTGRLRHTARLVWRTLPYALAQEGRTLAGDVAFVLDAPDGSTWTIGEADAATTIRGRAVDLCTVAGQRATAAERGLTGTGPDADAVLRLMRTFA
jgi:uncharacterized protein (TIGR03084 family)